MDPITFLLAVLLLELTPGPNMAYLSTLALSRGRTAGLIATVGVAFGLAVHATVAGLGAGVLIQQYPLLYDVLRWIGGRLSPVFGMGGLADRKGNFPRARRSYHYGRSAVPAWFPLERLQPEIDSVLRIGASYIRRSWAWRSVTPDPNGRIRNTLCGDSHRGSRDHCCARFAAPALVGGGSAATDCAPHSVRVARLRRNLAGVDDASLTRVPV